jgi:hypothetical protein
VHVDDAGEVPSVKVTMTWSMMLVSSCRRLPPAQVNGILMAICGVDQMAGPETNSASPG